jgi:hypothetical protein
MNRVPEPSVVYTRRPSAAAFAARAIAPRSGWMRQPSLPDLQLRWRGYTVDPEEVRRMLALAGAPAHGASPGALLLAPHVTGFALTMAALTQPGWPLPIRHALQVRNRLVLHGPIEPGRPYDLVLRTAGWRILDKGLEVDLHTRLQEQSQTLWESIVTFYYRGRFGAAGESGEARGAAAASPRIEETATELERWQVQAGGRWAFAKLTGDFNPLHQWGAYARRLGFRAATAHPQRIAARCLGHLPARGGAQQLDLWIKGPVYFGSDVVLRHADGAAGEGRDFGVWKLEESRPALVGRWRGLP